jgi:hypothetical protein
VKATIGIGGAKPSCKGPARVAAGTMITVPDGEGIWTRLEKDAELGW